MREWVWTEDRERKCGVVGDAPEQFKSRYVLNHFVLIEVCSVDLWVACVRISTGLKGFPSERRIYESTLVEQTKLLS